MLIKMISVAMLMNVHTMQKNDADEDVYVDVDDCPYDAENDADEDGYLW